MSIPTEDKIRKAFEGVRCPTRGFLEPPLDIEKSWIAERLSRVDWSTALAKPVTFLENQKARGGFVVHLLPDAQLFVLPIYLLAILQAPIDDWVTDIAALFLQSGRSAVSSNQSEEPLEVRTLNGAEVVEKMSVAQLQITRDVLEFSWESNFKVEDEVWQACVNIDRILERRS